MHTQLHVHALAVVVLIPYAWPQIRALAKSVCSKIPMNK